MSDDEINDGLNIKPPQPQRSSSRRHRDRDRDRQGHQSHSRGHHDRDPSIKMQRERNVNKEHGGMSSSSSSHGKSRHRHHRHDRSEEHRYLTESSSSRRSGSGHSSASASGSDNRRSQLINDRNLDLREKIRKRKYLEDESEKMFKEVAERAKKEQRIVNRGDSSSESEAGGREIPLRDLSPAIRQIEVEDIETSSLESAASEDEGNDADPGDGVPSSIPNVQSNSPRDQDNREQPENVVSSTGSLSDSSSSSSSSSRSDSETDNRSDEEGQQPDEKDEKRRERRQDKSQNGNSDADRKRPDSNSRSDISDGEIADVDADEPSNSSVKEGPAPELEKDKVPEMSGLEDDSQSSPALPCVEFGELSVYFPAIQGCRRVEEFHLLNKIEEGTYGVVYRAKDKRTTEIVALKRLKMERERDGFPITSLREINTLLKAQHENIVTVREIVVGSNTDKIFLVMDYVEHDLKSLMETLKQKDQAFIMGEVKCLLLQLLAAVNHLHDNWILHRDLKTSNLLLSHKGILKVGDFGLAREYGSPLRPYTSVVVTLWYRAPELLLGTKLYSTPIDIWSVGCIFGELLKMEPMFPGKSEANQLNLIFQTLGTPNDKIWPGYSELPLLQKMTFADYPVNKLKTKFNMLTELGIQLLNKFLTFDPARRITAADALQHKFFQEPPLPIDPSVFPTWPAKSEMGHSKSKMASPKPPSGGRQFKDLQKDDDADPSGFFLGVGDGRRPPIGAGFSLKF